MVQVLQWYRRQGIRAVVLSAGHMGEQVQAVFGALPGVRVVVEPAPLGTAGALRLALSQLDAPEVLVCNGDSFCAAAPRSLVKALAHPGALGALAIVEVPASADYGQVVALPGGRVTGFFEKEPPRAPRQWINAGVYAFSRAILPMLPEAGSLERDVFPLLAQRGELYAVRTSHPVLDIGTPERYAQAQTQLQRMLNPSQPTLAPGVVGMGSNAEPGVMAEAAGDLGFEVAGEVAGELAAGVADGSFTETLTDALSSAVDTAMGAAKSVDIVTPLLNVASDVWESLT